MYSLNDDGVAVTNMEAKPYREPVASLCGFAGDGDGYTRDAASVSCRDCMAALGTDYVS